ncbi:MAG: hypothetical protein K0R13_1522 [Propionibacteriaceae bacterium]|nr:hypothetical protein [Propionibacteriaceae bacterium]
MGRHGHCRAFADHRRYIFVGSYLRASYRYLNANLLRRHGAATRRGLNLVQLEPNSHSTKVIAEVTLSARLARPKTNRPKQARPGGKDPVPSSARPRAWVCEGVSIIGATCGNSRR